MPKHRSLDDDFWTDPKLKREPMHLRHLLAALITEAADDEGRFVVEPYGWLESYFARHDPVTEDDIVADWQRLQELGIALAYDGGKAGFLLAWFRRQIVNNPKPSTLPEPPPTDGIVTSRRMASAVYSAYVASNPGKGKSWMILAALWWVSLTPEERTVHNCTGQDGKVSNSNLHLLLGSEVKRSEVKTPTSKDLAQSAGNGPADHAPSPAKADKARLTAEKDIRDAERLRQQTEALEASLSALTPPDRKLLDSMLAGQHLAKGKPLTLLQQASQAETFAKELAEHGPECWRDCCRIACEKGIYTAEFARGCVKNWKPSGGGGNGQGSLHLTELDRLQITADHEREEAARGY